MSVRSFGAVALLFAASCSYDTLSSRSAALGTNDMLVLIDASGSMLEPRPGDTVNANRIIAAKVLAGQSLNDYAGNENIGLRAAAVYTFRGASTAIARTGGSYIDPNLALNAIDAIDPVQDVGGATPLAGAMCEAIDHIRTNGVATNRILQISSDGEENSTPMGHECRGLASTIPTPPYSVGSWHQKVWLKANTGSPVVILVDLFNNSTPGLIDPETGIPNPRHGNVNTLGPPTLAQFFAAIATATGGQLTVAEDNRPLPVFADMNEDRCVDRNDAILLARQFGNMLPGTDGKFDLDRNRVISYADYEMLLPHLSTTCGSPDPYVARTVVDCHTSRVVIDGAVIEHEGLTINSRGACEIVIRNSLIVAGGRAIQVQGKADITVDNSLIVGDGALFVTAGKTTVSAADTVFHGSRRSDGAFRYVDRGGNTWE